MQETLEKLVLLSKISPATDEEIVAYLRRSYQIAEIAASAEQETWILGVCEQLGITVTDEELQTAGDAFRQEHKLLGVSETMAWLDKQRITVKDWSQGIRLSLLKQKLKEHLFGEEVDNHYLNNRNDYKRMALSQILVHELTEAMKIAQSLREKSTSFCALALEYSKGKQSKENGGYVGIRFLSELMPEIAQALSEAKEGEVVGPLQTRLGYHIMRIEKWFPPELVKTREQVLESLFQVLLNKKNKFDFNSH
ncbi:MAG: peptidylprolyl isomerase [Coleofasciculus sp. G1-WW12-02]|uniref:peptidylprolyl isomerase n=1 Tax=Coleofasciculus sp. G1-WW12-02 TaxID=3068483 RepID=UPI003304CA35